MLALLGAHQILHVSGIRVNNMTTEIFGIFRRVSYCSCSTGNIYRNALKTERKNNILTVWNNNNNNNNNTHNKIHWNSRASRCNSFCLLHAFGIKTSALAPVTRTTVLRCFPQSLITFSRTVNQIMPLSFSSTYFWRSACCLLFVQSYKICATEASTKHKCKNYKKKMKPVG